MRAIPLTPGTAAAARRIMWFEDPAEALAEPVRFLAYAMARATHEDLAEIRRHVSDAELAEALDLAPPGIIDERSWWYWHLVLKGLSPPPPMPARRLG